jgi:hypothetical protein
MPLLIVLLPFALLDVIEYTQQEGFGVLAARTGFW